MKRKIFCIVLSALLLLGTLAACGGTDAPATTSAPAADPSGTGEPAAAGEGYSIGYSNMALKEDFFITVEAGIRKECETLGYEYNTTISDRDATKMKQNIEALVTMGADIIIDFNVMAEAGSAIASDLDKEGIPMLSVDCVYEGAYFFGVNNLEAGNILGEATIPFVDEKFGGEIEYIVNLYDDASGPEVKKRNDGVVEVLQEKYSVPDENVIWLDSRQDDVKTQTMTRDWLNSHPEATKVVFVGQNDDRGFAINAAVEGENRIDDALIVSHNADPASVENLQKHEADKDTAWVATASYNSHLYGVQIVDMATRILNGEEVAQSEYTKVTIVTCDNVTDYVTERDEIIASLG